MEGLIFILAFLAGWTIRFVYSVFSDRTLKKEFKKLKSDNSTLKEYMGELLLRYDRSLSKEEEKEHFRAASAARLEGVFHTFPWKAT